MAAAISYKRVVIRLSIGSALLGFAAIISYVLIGHAVMKAIYESNVSFFDQILQGKETTPLQAYFAALDKAVVTVAVSFFLASTVLIVLATNPLGLLLFGASFLLGTLIIFLVLDLFPALVKPLHFDMIPYFNYRLTYVPDPVLGFRERPYNEAQITNFRGFAYSPLYGIDVRPQTLRWRTDAEGFRNASGSSAADVVVIGSSFTEYGIDLEDTYSARLEKKLGQKVVNLGKAGYGPFQYLKALEKYGIKKKPKYVIFAFYAPGDVDGYLVDWVKGRDNGGLAARSIAFGGFFPRYRIALQQAWRMLSSGAWTSLQLGLQQIVGTELVHPDVAILSLPGNATKKILFFDRHSTRTPDDLLSSPEWRAFEKILMAFQRASEQHQFVPVLVYIPAATEIYAEYSTQESGLNWQGVRDSYVATSGSNEAAARRLAAKHGIELISLLPAYREAAREGKLLYYLLDSHWNSAGREIAAEATAEGLKAFVQARQNSVAKPPKEMEKIEKDNWGAQHVDFDRNSSFFTRTIDGKINTWSPGAEELYGWKTAEAIGQISHKLLKTKFPEPLAQIDAQLVQSGRWQGKLVHATRDGRRVVVESRWNLEKDSGAVVEINIPSADS